MNINNLAAEIALNNLGEQSAIEGYFKLLSLPGFPQEFYKDIQEIISDEMNHSAKLSGWVVHLTGIQPAKD